MKCKNKYQLPLRLSDIELWNRTASPAHIGKLRYSLDFKTPKGTPIYAATSGLVVWLKKDSNKSSLSKKYYFDSNRIVIKHAHGEYSAYEHLKYRGVLVKKNQKVKKGQLIGYSGNTGWSPFPHLHFEVFHKPTSDESEGVTLKISFPELKNKPKLTKKNFKRLKQR